MMSLSRIGLKLSLLWTLFTLGLIAAMARILMDNAREAAVGAMQVRAESFARSCREAMFPQLDPFSLHFATQEAVKEEAVVFAAVLGPDGRILSHSDPRRIGETAGREPSPRDSRTFDLSAPIAAGGRPLGTVRLGLTEASVARALGKTRRQVFRLAGAAVLLSALGTTVLVGWLMRPVRLLARTAREVGEGNLDARVRHESWDELGQLARSFNEMVAGLQERERLRRLFGRILEPEVASLLLKEDANMVGRRCDVSVMMCDIRDFTRISERLQPEEVVLFLNAYFSQIVEVIHRHRGTVDKFVGDGILAVFGAPVALGDHAARAMACALDIRRHMAGFNAARVRRGEEPIRFGIAVNSGVAVAGPIGAKDRIEYTVIGDTVNLASRLEGLNIKYRTDILVTHSTRRLTRKLFAFKTLGMTHVKGRVGPVRIFHLLGPADAVQGAPCATPARPEASPAPLADAGTPVPA